MQMAFSFTYRSTQAVLLVTGFHRSNCLISQVKQWMTSDKLMLKEDKPEFIVIASRHLLKKRLLLTLSG